MAYPFPFGYCQLSDVQARINAGSWDSTKTGAMPTQAQVNQFILEAATTIDVVLRKTGYFVPLRPVAGLAVLPPQVFTYLLTLNATLATGSVERTRHGSAEENEDTVSHYWIHLGDDLLARLEGGHDNLTIWGCDGDFPPIADQSKAVSMQINDPLTGIPSTPAFSRSMLF